MKARLLSSAILATATMMIGGRVEVPHRHDVDRREADQQASPGQRPASGARPLERPPKRPVDEPDTQSQGFDPSIFIDWPPHGSFSLEDEITISGSIEGMNPHLAAVRLNGHDVRLRSDGSFESRGWLDHNAILTPFLAELFVLDPDDPDAFELVARDRIVVHAGYSLPDGGLVDSALAVTMTDEGMHQIQPQVNYEVLSFVNGLTPLDFYDGPPPLIGGYPGGANDVGFYLDITGAGVGCDAIELTFNADTMTVDARIYNTWVNYHAHAFMHEGPIDIDVNCNGQLMAGLIIAQADLAFAPGSSPGAIDVQQVGPLNFNICSVNNVLFDGPCDWIVDIVPPLDDIINFQLIPSFIAKAEAHVNDILASPQGNGLLTQLIEGYIQEFDLQDAIGTVDGMEIAGFLTDIEVQPGKVTAIAKASVDAIDVHPDAPQIGPTFRDPEPMGPPAADIAGGFSIRIDTALVNQMLKAQTEAGALNSELTQLDVGLGEPLPLTASLLYGMIPDLAGLEPSTPLVFVTRPTLAPLVTTANPKTDLDLRLGQYVFELRLLEDPDFPPLFAAAIDLSLPLSITFDPVASELTTQVGVPHVTDATVLNGATLFLADVLEDSLVESIMPLLASSANVISSVPLPDLADFNLELAELTIEPDAVAAGLDYTPDFGQPDLAITWIDAPAVIDRNWPFAVGFELTNLGSQPAFGPIQVGALLSFDELISNNDDFGIGQWTVFFGPQGLAPGQSMTYSFMTIAPQVATFGTQNLILTADLGPPALCSFPGPDNPMNSGFVCETSELNNISMVPIEVSAADVWIESLECPDGLVSLPIPGEYKVTVCRDEVGVLSLNVPVTVTLGNPVLFYQDVWTTLAPNECKTLSVWVGTPGPPGPSCGDTITYPVLACSNMNDDRDYSNNCASSTVGVETLYYDLHYSVTSSSDTYEACDGQSIGWTVHVTNTGNGVSLPVCSRTALSLSSGNPQFWSDTAGINFFTVPSLDPGATFTYTVSNYHLDCILTAEGQQFLKAGVDYSAPVECGDACLAGNIGSKPVWIDKTPHDAEIVAVNVLDAAFTGQPVLVEIVVRNNSLEPLFIPVNLQASAPGFPTFFNPDPCGVALDAGGQTTISCWVDTPPVPANCGSAPDVTVTACVGLNQDADSSNDCASDSFEPAYWDLHVIDIIGPSSATNSCFGCYGQDIDYKIKVKNTGNIGSPSRCCQTGVFWGSGDWLPGSWTPGIWTVNIPAMGPGQTKTINVNNYGICFLEPGTRWIKALIPNGAAGCGDDCNAGNFRQESITINCN